MRAPRKSFPSRLAREWGALNGFKHARHSPQAVVGGFHRFAHSAGPGVEEKKTARGDEGEEKEEQKSSNPGKETGKATHAEAEQEGNCRVLC